MAGVETTALQRAVGFLARREHSLYELRGKLSRRDYPEEEIDAALQRLLAKGLQSDERFTQAYLQSRQLSGLGPYKVIAELKRRGVDEALVDQVMRKQDFDWYQHAVQVYQKKYADTPVSDYKERAKRSRFLQQRGFSSEQIQHAIGNFDDAN